MNATISALANGTLASAALAAAVWLALHRSPRDALNAATRYAIWWIVLLAAIALPLLYLPARIAHGPVARQSATAGGAALHANAPSETAAPPAFVWRTIDVPGSSWTTPLLLSWIAISALLILRVAFSYIALYRRSARASDAPSRFQQRLGSWLSQVGAGARHVRLAGSDDVSMPVATGPHHPSILIPNWLFDEASDEELDQIGLHEAAHLARRDDYALIAQRLFEAVFALHPVVRWVARQIDLEREIACDDLVVASTGRPQAYAACLTRMVALCSGTGQLMASTVADNRSHVSQRVELLVAATLRPGTRLAFAKLGAFATALAALILGLAYTPGVVEFASAHSAATPAPASAAPRIAAIPMAIGSSVLQPPAAPRPRKAPPVLSAVIPVMEPSDPPVNEPQKAAEQLYASHRLIAVLFDVPSIPASDRQRALGAMRNYFATQMRPADLVAILGNTGAGIQVMQDFTDNTTELGHVAEKLLGGDAVPPNPNPSGGRLATLEGAVHILGVVPGKKALIYFSSGLPRDSDNSDMQRVIQAAMAADVAFYPIDTRGLVMH